MKIEFQSPTDPDQIEACAKMMLESDPWITLARSLPQCRAAMQGDFKEVHLAMAEGELLGFVVLQMAGTFRGYIQTVCVAPAQRGKGIGSRLIAFAEERIFRVSPNVFMCVSSFNVDAQRLYARLGYQVVGELTDFFVRGYSEILLRKTLGPSSEFVVG